MYGLGKKFNLNDLSPVLNVTKEIREYSVKRIIFDSRLAQKGDLFIPLKGLNYDGEDFCKDAIDNGAAVLTTKIINGPAIKVNDVYKSLLEICNYKLLSLKPKIIFITGSYGKTTIKDMLKTILGPSCHASKENENNKVTVAFSTKSWKDRQQKQKQQKKLQGDEAALAAGLRTLKTLCYDDGENSQTTNFTHPWSHFDF